MVDCFLTFWSSSKEEQPTGRCWTYWTHPFFRKRFELEDDDIEVFRSWIRSCHAHWGFDGEHRARFGSVKSDEHTWRHALERMALGYCMHSNDERMWVRFYPLMKSKARMPNGLEKLYKVIDGLGGWNRKLPGIKSLQEWTKFLEKLTDFLYHR